METSSARIVGDETGSGVRATINARPPWRPEPIRRHAPRQALAVRVQSLPTSFVIHAVLWVLVVPHDLPNAVALADAKPSLGPEGNSRATAPAPSASPRASHAASSRDLHRPAPMAASLAAPAVAPLPDRRGPEREAVPREKISFPNDSPAQISTLARPCQISAQIASLLLTTTRSCGNCFVGT